MNGGAQAGWIWRFRDGWVRHLWMPMLVWLVVTFLVIGMLVWVTERSRGELRDEYVGDTETAAGIMYRAVVERQQVLFGAIAESLLAEEEITLEALEQAAKALGFDAVAVLDSRGVYLTGLPTSASSDLMGTNIRPMFEHIDRAVAEWRPVASQAYSSPSLESAGFALAVPYSTPSGGRIFAAAVPLAGDRLTALIEGATGLDLHTLYLIDREDNILVGPDAPIGEITPLSAEAPALTQAMRSDASGFVEVGGVSRFYASAPVGDTGWRLIAQTPARSLYGPVILDRAPMRATLIVFVLAGLMAAVSLSLAGRRRWLDSIHTKSLNLQLTRSNENLRRANAELEAFTYSVSHDLRAPLRGISGFSEALMQDYGDALDATGKDYAERIRLASHHLAKLMDDLLELSRISRTELVVQDTDLSELVGEMAEELRRRDPQRTATVEIQDNVVVLGDRTLLEITIRNLMDNAWKFTSEKPETHIRFGAVELPGEMECVLEDNGAGFDQAYVEKLFQPFQRLHDSAEFPGTGIGLVTVKRVIEKSGGRVWAEGTPQKGATFHFTLPYGEQDAA